MAKKRDPLEQVIRAAVRVQERLRKEGIALRFTMYFEPCEPARKRSARPTDEQPR